MEKFEILNQEIQQLEEKIIQKRKENVKSKLQYLQENDDNERAHLTEEEWGLLKEFLIKHGSCTSVKMQHSWYDDIDGFDTDDYDTIIRVGNKYVYVHDGKDQGFEDFSFQVSDKIKIEHKKLEGEYDMDMYDSKELFTINGIDFRPSINNGWNGVVQVIEGKGELTKPLDIEALFEIDKKQSFEQSLLKDNVVEYYLSKTPRELEKELGSEVARMVGFEQKNSHHCYDLWEHTLRTVEGIKPNGLTPEQFKKLRIAAFFHDIGKPDVAKFNEKTGQQVFYGHAMHSIDVAKPILEKLGYSTEEIEQLSFYIGHHDDFISYKARIAPWMKNHEFIRGIDSDTVSEKIIENQYNFEAMGYDKDQIRHICYTLGHDGQEPVFTTKDGTIEIKVNMAEVQDKIDSGKYKSEFVATEEDYRMLLELCKADAGAQSEIAIQQGRQVGSKKEKLETMNAIQNTIPEAYKSVSEKVKGYSFEQFIKDSIPQTLGEIRPKIMCKDGTEYSIQASSFHYCNPRKDGLTNYEEFEVGKISDWITGNLGRYVDGDKEIGVCGYVPKEVIEEIIKAHGGLDKKVMKERIEEQQAVYRPRSDAYERMVREASGGNEFLEKMIRYATRKCEIRDKNEQAKQLLQDYEAQLPKEQQSVDEDN